MNALRLAILQTIGKFNGEYGWYQIDRDISSSGVIVSENLLSVLRELESNDLIASINNNSSEDPKYSLRPKGLAIINPGKKEGQALCS